MPQSHRPVRVFISYSHEDEELLRKLLKHLASLERQGIIIIWHDHKIGAGKDWEGKISEHLESADIILLLISASFMDSDYCNNVEAKRALERREAGEALVIPVLMRAVNFTNAAFSHLQFLPSNSVPVASWDDCDKALVAVTVGLQEAAEELLASDACDLPPLIPRPPAHGFVMRCYADGRDMVQHLKEELAPPGNKSVTLSGLGGVGKTALAAEVARSWMKVYGSRVIWSNATARADYTFMSLLDDIARQLGRPELVALADEEKKAEQMYSLVAGRHTLIVLDNYEATVPDEEPLIERRASEKGRARETVSERKSIKSWFERAQCSALFISRELDMDSNTLNIMVPPMSRTESLEFIRLMVRQTGKPHLFTEEICHRIYERAYGRPLLMKWIVARISESGAQEDIFEDVKQGKGEAAERIFDDSFNLRQLGEDGRVTLLALSLFKPSATREALAEVAGFRGNKERLTKAIANLSRLRLIEGADEKNRRLVVQGLTLSMAAARLPKSKHAAGIWKRFVAYYKNYALNLDWTKPEDPANLIEKSNILRAIQVAPCIKDWDTVVELYDTTLGYINSFRVWAKAIELSEKFAEQRIKIESQLPPILIKIPHREKEEEKAKVKGHYESLNEKLDEGKVWKRIVLSAVKFELGVFAYECENYPLARALFDKAETLKREFGDVFGVGITCNNLGATIAKCGAGDWLAEATLKFNEAAELFKAASVADKQDSRAAKGRDKHEEALCPFADSGSPKKQGARFAKVVMRNLQWLDRLKPDK